MHAQDLLNSPTAAPPADKSTPLPGEGWPVFIMIAVAGALDFLGSWFRYHAFRAGALDLGLFDQAIYLISIGKVPRSTIIGIHMLADHASYALILIAQLYRIHPTVCWLFAIQSASMAGAAWPLWRLARQSGISRPMAQAIVVSYLLYPVVATAVLRDFYPETLAVPALLAAVLCARQRRPIGFIFWVLLGLSTKEVMAVTFAATGIYLVAHEHRKAYGLAALLLSLGWYLIATKYVIPHFGDGHQPNSMRFFSYMGSTQGQIVHTMLLRPWVPIRFLASAKTATYLLAIFVPVAWGLSRRSVPALLCAAPCMLLNLFSNNPAFRNPFFHYSWPVVPFVFLAIMATIADGKGWFQRRRWIIAWSVGLVLIGLAARGHEANTKQLAAGAGSSADEKNRVLAMINDQGGVLATHQTASHLSERKVIQFVYDPSDPVFKMPADNQLDWVLLDFNEDSVQNVGAFGTDILRKYESAPDFREIYHNRALYLFHRIAAAP